jgi:hypothetical protein
MILYRKIGDRIKDDRGVLAACNCSDASLLVLVADVPIFPGKDTELMNYLPKNPKMIRIRTGWKRDEGECAHGKTY